MNKINRIFLNVVSDEWREKLKISLAESILKGTSTGNGSPWTYKRPGSYSFVVLWKVQGTGWWRLGLPAILASWATSSRPPLPNDTSKQQQLSSCKFSRVPLYPIVLYIYSILPIDTKTKQRTKHIYIATSKSRAWCPLYIALTIYTKPKIILNAIFIKTPFLAAVCCVLQKFWDCVPPVSQLCVSAVPESLVNST